MKAFRAVLALVACLTLTPAVSAQITTPEAHFGFRMGADRELGSADQIERYFELVASQSDRVKLIDIGPTTEGNRTLAALVSAPENIHNLDAIRRVNQRLSDPRTLTPEEAHALTATHKAVLAIGASIHASEVGASQAANELLYWLTDPDNADTRALLDNVVIILIPMLNPDGHRLVVDWYNRTKGTPFEGGPMPWLYHKYAGHDINRDGFMMNLAESRNLAKFFYEQWHPQVFLTLHQMEENGPRFFVPPNTDPIDLNYDPLIWRSAAFLGDAMALELQREGKSGVVSSAKYDYYWPGFEDSAPLGHNTVCLLTEVASVDVATPITVTASELRAGFKGLVDYRAQINFPDPWPGGRWTLRDIVEYDLAAVRGLIVAVSSYRERVVENFYQMGRRAVAAGERGGPYAFIIPEQQFDPSAKVALENLLMAGAIEIHRALEPFRVNEATYPEGTDIVFLAQPYRAYAKTLLERQRYPARRFSADGPWERPYDVAGWTLPDQMGVQVIAADRPFDVPTTTRLVTAKLPMATVWGERKPSYWLVDARGNGAAVAVNRLVAAGVTPSWIGAPIETNGFRYEAGSIVVPYAKKHEAVVARIASELGLRIDGMKGKAPATARAIGRGRVALYKPWTETIDEGWTRWLLERYEFSFSTITDRDVRAGGLRARFDIVIVPSAAPDRLQHGLPTTVAPAEYTGGLGDEGTAALRAFVADGGTLLCLSQASEFAIDAFGLPLRDVAKDNDRIFVPGSIVRLDLDPSQPLAFGMPEHTAAMFAFSAAFDPTSPATRSEGGSAPPPWTTVARYATRDLLLSGWLEGERELAGRAAIADVPSGTGHVLLFGLPVQHRAQSLATFRLLFNAILTAPQPPTR